MFGTVNLDMRSLWLNYEVALFIYQPEFATPCVPCSRSYIGSVESSSIRRTGQRGPSGSD